MLRDFHYRDICIYQIFLNNVHFSGAFRRRFINVLPRWFMSLPMQWLPYGRSWMPRRHFGLLRFQQRQGNRKNSKMKNWCLCLSILTNLIGFSPCFNQVMKYKIDILHKNHLTSYDLDIGFLHFLILKRNVLYG